MKPRAFVIMPFRRPYDGYFTEIYATGLAEAGFEVTKADDLFVPRPIIDDIRAKILEAELILCEMSGRNPNVFYELGLAHAIGKPAILLSSSKKDIPFDLQHVRTILYDTKTVGWETRLRQNITAAAHEVSRVTVSWPSPLATQAVGEYPDRIPGVERVFPNLPSCEQEILDELAKSRTIRIFLQLGKTVLVGAPTIYEFLEKSLQSAAAVRVLHAGLESRYLTKRIAFERGSSYDEWVSDIEYVTKKLNNLKKRSVGVVHSRTHDEAYYWLIFLFDETAYVQPYIYAKSNTKRSPVLKLRGNSVDNDEQSLYTVFDRYFERKWDESIGAVKRLEDLFHLGEIERGSIAAAAVAKLNDLYVFVIPNRYLRDEPPLARFHAIGGKVKHGETPHHALLREVMEEVGCGADIKSANRTLVMSSHSDIGEVALENQPAPRYVYKRMRSAHAGHTASVMWVLGYTVALAENAVLSPHKEIAALLLVTKRMLGESISRRVHVSEILAATDGSTIIQAKGAPLLPSTVLAPSGLASILASL